MVAADSSDLFATRNTRQTRRFFSWNHDPVAEGTDAFAQPWPKKGAYAHPPWKLIPQVLRKIKIERCQVVLVTPMWRSQPWWPELIRMIDANPIIVEHHPHLYLPPTELSRWNIVIWRVNGDRHATSEFRRRQRFSRPRAAQHSVRGHEYLIQDSLSGGARNEAWIPCWRLDSNGWMA